MKQINKSLQVIASKDFRERNCEKWLHGDKNGILKEKIRKDI